jgi:hypothetical protein
MRSLLIALVALTGVHVYAQTTPTAAATQLKTQLTNAAVSLTSTSNTNNAGCPSPYEGRTNCLEVTEICCDSFGNVVGLDLNNKGLASLAGITLPDSLLRLQIENDANFASLPSPLPPNLQHLWVSSSNELTAVPELPSSLTYLNLNDNSKLAELPGVLPASLTYLGVCCNLLTSLPNVPASLISLMATRSQLTTLPDLPNGLRTLEVAETPLNSLPAMPASLESLIVHNLKGDLTVLPDLSGCTALGHLRAECESSTKKLTSLGAGLPNSLTYLIAHSCALTAMPSYPSGVTFSTYLDLHSNENWLCPVANDQWVGTTNSGVNFFPITTSDVCVCPPGKNLPSGEESKSIVVRQCADNPTCDASTTVLDNAADAGDCTATLAAAASCTQTPNAGFSCTASTCADAGTTLSAGSCTANPTCDASSVLQNAADAGSCSATLAAAASCTQTPNAGFTCTASTCADAGTNLTAGSCTPSTESDSAASVVAGIWSVMAFTALF